MKLGDSGKTHECTDRTDRISESGYCTWDWVVFRVDESSRSTDRNPVVRQP